jgi:hypothetical protein
MLAFAIAVILGPESRGTYDSVLLSEILEIQVLVFISSRNRVTQL